MHSLYFSSDDVLKDPAQSRREKFKQTKHKEAEVCSLHRPYNMCVMVKVVYHTKYHHFSSFMIVSAEGTYFEDDGVCGAISSTAFCLGLRG